MGIREARKKVERTIAFWLENYPRTIVQPELEKLATYIREQSGQAAEKEALQEK
jgi:hypothetical protein